MILLREKNMKKTLLILFGALIMQVYAADTPVVVELAPIINKWDSLTGLQRKEWNAKNREKLLVDGWGQVKNVEEVSRYEQALNGSNADVVNEKWKVTLICPLNDGLESTNEVYVAVLYFISSKGLSAINKSDLLGFGGKLRSILNPTPLNRSVTTAYMQGIVLKKVNIDSLLKK